MLIIHPAAAKPEAKKAAQAVAQKKQRAKSVKTDPGAAKPARASAPKSKLSVKRNDAAKQRSEKALKAVKLKAADKRKSKRQDTVSSKLVVQQAVARRKLKKLSEPVSAQRDNRRRPIAVERNRLRPGPAAKAAAPEVAEEVAAIVGTQAPQPQALPEGARQLDLHNLRTHERLKIVYRTGEAYLPEAMAKLNWFLRDYRCNRAITMDPQLIDLVWMLQQEFGLKVPVKVVSAYRTEGYNASLLRSGRSVDPDSQHMLGKAVDVIFPGVSLDALKDAAQRYKLGGVGTYPFTGPPFVHLDTGPLRDWREEKPAAKLPVILRRGNVKLDCDLRMSDVLSTLSYEAALAALPKGAASTPWAAVQSSALPPPHNGGEAAAPHPVLVPDAFRTKTMVGMVSVNSLAKPYQTASHAMTAKPLQTTARPFLMLKYFKALRMQRQSKAVAVPPQPYAKVQIPMKLSKQRATAKTTLEFFDLFTPSPARKRTWTEPSDLFAPGS